MFACENLPRRATICSARVIASGWNIPCINGSFLIPEFNSTTGYGHIDYGFLDAQDITNIEIETAQSPPLMNEVNKVILITYISMDMVENTMIKFSISCVELH